MGTPVPSKLREQEYSESYQEPEVIKRKLTDEERRYYDSLKKPKKRIVAYNYPDVTLFSEDKESEEMGKEKIPMPTKEWILERCKDYAVKTKAVYAIAKECNASAPVVFSWFKQLGIDYDFKSNIIKNPSPAERMQAAEQVPCNGDLEADTREFNDVIKQESVHFVNISEGINSKPLSQGLVAKIKNAQYTIGNACVVVEFENEQIKVTPEGLSFEEAAALVELLNDIL